MRKLLLIASMFTCAATVSVQAQYTADLNEDAVRKVVTDVVKKQIELYPTMDDIRVHKETSDLSWANGVYLSALSKWANFDNNQEFIKWYEDIAKKNYYQPFGKRMYHADDVAVCLTYATIYDKTKNQKVIDPTIARLEFIMNHPSPVKMAWGIPNAQDRWNWCDALYMAPPVFAKYANLTGNNRMRDFMDKEFWATYDHLYDRSERLFFRDARYFDKKENNGQKVFWGRGNGWVIGGLTLILDELPATYPSRERYVKLYKDMTDRIVELQGKDGYWSASMLDAASYPNPETSSTGFMTYSIWWGINNGLLDKDKYLPAAKKGWEALVKAVHPNGMLGWVQPIGADPQKVTADMTEVYGAGSFMMTGQEIIKFLRNNK